MSKVGGDASHESPIRVVVPMVVCCLCAWPSAIVAFDCSDGSVQGRRFSLKHGPFLTSLVLACFPFSRYGTECRKARECG